MSLYANSIDLDEMQNNAVVCKPLKTGFLASRPILKRVCAAFQIKSVYC